MFFKFLQSNIFTLLISFKAKYTFVFLYSTFHTLLKPPLPIIDMKLKESLVITI